MNRARNIVYLVVVFASATFSLQARVKLRNGALSSGQDSLVIRGVAYSNVPVGRRPFDSQPAVPCLYARDLPLIAALGANTVRTYAAIPADDTVFLKVLESSKLYWLAGFPLDPFYDPSRSITSVKPQILQAFRAYAGQFTGQPRLIAYVFGNEVARDYNLKFAGSPADFYNLMSDVSAILQSLEPDDAPLLTTAVNDPSEFRNDAYGLSFWSWNAYPGRSFSGQLQAAIQKTTRPVLISEYGLDAFDQQQVQESEAAQADAAWQLTSEIQASTALLGGVYSEFVDQWWKGGADTTSHALGGSAIAAFPDGFRNEAWQGIFRSVATNQPGLDTLQPRTVFQTLASFWGGKAPAAWAAGSAPVIDAFENAASGAAYVSPGSLMRFAGQSLAESSLYSPANDVWPPNLGFDCLCVGNNAAPLGFASAQVLSAQVPWSQALAATQMIFYRAGIASNAVSTRVAKYSPGIFPGGVMRARTGCAVTQQSGVSPGAMLEVFGTGLGTATTTTADIRAVVNGVPARVLYAGLLPSLAGVNQINVQVDPATPPSPSASLMLQVDQAPSNLYSLTVLSPSDQPAILLHASQNAAVLQPGGPSQSLNINIDGVNGFCDSVFFGTPGAPNGISYQIPLASAGQQVPLQLTAAPGARPGPNAKFVLDGYGAGAVMGEVSIALTILPSQGDIPVRVVSGGFKSTPLSLFDWNGQTIYSTTGGGAGRGVNVLTVAPDTGVLSSVRNFDTWGDPWASAALLSYLTGLSNGTLVMFSVADEATYRLTPDTRSAIASWFGSQSILTLAYQQSWALIGRKGAKSPLAEGASADAQVALAKVLTFPMQ